MSTTPPFVTYSVPRVRPGWVLEEGMMPESDLHQLIGEQLKAILDQWAKTAAGHYIGRNLAIRWIQAEPRVGVDPDVCVVTPPPPGADDHSLRSVRTWLEGHEPPILAIEVVSETKPRKDYSIAPDKYAASGTNELVVFDPLLSGPTAHGGPFLLQVWRRGSDGFARCYEGDGPAYSDSLGAYLVVVDKMLRIADDEGGTRLWRTATEEALAAKDEALARIAQLEAELAKRGG